MSYWIDSHCHMNDVESYDADFDAYMLRAKQNNVLISNVISLDKQQFEYSLLKKQQYPNLDLSFGFFPEDCLKVTQEDFDYLESQMDKIIGVGEIGLDYYYSKENIEQQQKMFIRLIELANRYNKPIEIHSRNASKDTYDILKKYAKTKVLMHCYSDSYEMMKEYLKLGYYISFSGVVTFKNANEPKKNALNVPLDRILTETDCPYLTPVPFRGSKNETAYVKYTGEYIAQLRGIEIEELQQQIMKNYALLFNKELNDEEN